MTANHLWATVSQIKNDAEDRILELLKEFPNGNCFPDIESEVVQNNLVDEYVKDGVSHECKVKKVTSNPKEGVLVSITDTVTGEDLMVDCGWCLVETRLSVLSIVEATLADIKNSKDDVC